MDNNKFAQEPTIEIDKFIQEPTCIHEAYIEHGKIYLTNNQADYYVQDFTKEEIDQFIKILTDLREQCFGTT